VAVEEPRARVVREESDRDVITRLAHAHDVADDGVIVVVVQVTSAADNMERMSVQVHGVLREGKGRACQTISTHAKRCMQTHRPTSNARRHGNFDAHIASERVDTSGRDKLRRIGPV